MTTTQDPIPMTATEEKAVSRSNSPKSYLSYPIVTITCKESGKKYYVHKSLLTSHSGYFTNCLRPEFREGQNLEVELEEIDDRALQTTLEWLYDEQHEIPCHINYGTSVIEAYHLANRFEMPELEEKLISDLENALENEYPQVEPACLLVLERYSLLSSEMGCVLLKHFGQVICRAQSYDPLKPDVSLQLRSVIRNREIASEMLNCILNLQENEWHAPFDV